MARVRAAAQFRVGPRRFGAGPQLVVGEGVRRAGEHLAALHIGIGRGERLLGADDGEECDADGILHREARQPLVGASAGDARFCLADHGAAQTEVERLPGEQRARGASPHALADADGSTGPEMDGQDRLRQQLTEDVVGGGAIRLPERVESRQIGGSWRRSRWPSTR